MRHWKRRFGRLVVQTWPYANGRAQSFYAWLPGWTLHVVVIRKDRPMP